MQKCWFFGDKNFDSVTSMQLWLGKYGHFLLQFSIVQVLMLFANNTNSFRKIVSDLYEWCRKFQQQLRDNFVSIFLLMVRRISLCPLAVVQILVVASCIIHNSFQNFMQIRISPRKEQFITYYKKYKVIGWGRSIQFQMRKKNTWLCKKKSRTFIFYSIIVKLKLDEPTYMGFNWFIFISHNILSKKS